MLKPAHPGVARACAPDGRGPQETHTKNSKILPCKKPKAPYYACMKPNPNIHHRKDGIIIETLFHRPDGRCHAIIQVPLSLVEKKHSEWNQDAFGTIREMLQPIGLMPKSSWESFYDVAKRGWIIRCDADPIEEQKGSSDDGRTETEGQGRHS